MNNITKSARLSSGNFLDVIWECLRWSLWARRAGVKVDLQLCVEELLHCFEAYTQSCCSYAIVDVCLLKYVTTYLGCCSYCGYSNR